MVKAWEIPSFSKAEGERRHRKIRELMAYRGIDCLIISGHLGSWGAQKTNINYVSNYPLWMADEHIVFPLKGEPVIFVWGSGHEWAAKKVSWIPVKASGKGSYDTDIAARIKELGLEKGTLGIVSMYTMPAMLYLGLKEKLPYATFVNGSDILTRCRAIKSAEELEFVRKSGELGDRAVEAIAKAAKPGVDEYFLTARCESAIIEGGGEHGTFLLMESGPWSERGIAIQNAGSRRKLQKGDIILDELTPSYGGYYIQQLRPISIGKPPDDFMQLYQLHLELHELALKELRPGNTIDAITAKLVDYASKKGDFTRVWALQDCDNSETAFGVTVPSNAEIEPGMTFVNHPFTSGKVHTRHIIGSSYIVTEGEPECVSKLPIELIVV